MTVQRRQILASLLIGFLIGLVVGARIQKSKMTKIDTFKEQGPDPTRVITKLNERLGLDPKQQDEIRQIAEKRRTEVLALQVEVYDRFESIRVAMREDIRRTLNAEQLKKFDDIVVKWDEKRKRLEPPPRKLPTALPNTTR